MKLTLLSKGTVLILTLVTILLTVGGLGFMDVVRTGFLPQNAGIGVLAILIGALIYALAWIVALADSIQERAWGWTIGLLILSPVVIGPVIYSLLGPKNTK